MAKSTFITVVGFCIFVIFFVPSSDAKPRYHGPYIVNRWYLMEGFSETPYTECGGSGTIQKVEVIPCSDDVCNLKTGSSAQINIGFTPKSNTAKLTAIVHGVVAGIPMPFHFPQVDACQKSNITCPLKSGTSYSYSVQLPVLSTYPKIKVLVKWELKDEGGKDVICIEIPARLT